MWVPHTIPPVILRAFTPGDHKTDLETIKRQYEGRILRSEDPEWHVGALPKGQISLALLCLEMIIDGYEYYVQLTKCRNYIIQRNFNANQLKSSYSVGGSIASFEEKNIIANSTEKNLEAKPKEETLEAILECQLRPNVLDILTDLQRMAVIEELDIEEIPFHIAVETIPDEHYWQRAVTTLFPDNFKTDSTWRKTYLKLYTENYIEQFNPRVDDLNHLVKIIKLVSAEITTLKIEQILPHCFGAETESATHVPIPEDDELGVGIAAEFDEGFPKADEMVERAFRKQSMAMRKQSEAPESEVDAESSEFRLGEDGESRISASDALSSVRSHSVTSGKENLLSEKSSEESKLQPDVEEEPLQVTDRCSHLDFSEFLPMLQCLKEISLVFEVRNVGFDWDEAFFKFTDEDCDNLAKALRSSPTIEIFEIKRSHINGNQFTTLVTDGIIHMPSLKRINVSYNSIADIGALAIKNLMINGSNKSLQTILLCRNKITDEGAKLIGEALKLNDHVRNIDLRLNFIGKDGCEAVAEGLEENKALEYLSLCGNRLDSSACFFIGKMLCNNDNLKELDLSCNTLMVKGGEYLYHAVKHNNKLRKINLRLTDIGFDLEYNIIKCVESVSDRNISTEDRMVGLTLFTTK